MEKSMTSVVVVEVAGGGSPLKKLPRLTLLVNGLSLHFSKENNTVGKSPSQNVKYTIDTYTTSIISMFPPTMPYDYE
jgi:hypothetical protein